MSTSSPGRHEPLNECLSCQPPLLGDLGQGLMPSGFYQLSRTIAPGSECLRGLAAVPGDSGPLTRACGVDQHSRATRARVPQPEVLTSSPG